jgi:hypothetical protein
MSPVDLVSGTRIRLTCSTSTPDSPISEQYIAITHRGSSYRRTTAGANRFFGGAQSRIFLWSGFKKDIGGKPASGEAVHMG